MSGDFDVFDEWGTYVGKFTPAGGGWDGCLFAIAMLILWTAGFLIFLLIKLIKKGLKAVGVDLEKKWPGWFGLALCLAPPVYLILWLVIWREELDLLSFLATAILSLVAAFVWYSKRNK